MSTEQIEKELYERMWKTEYTPSACAIPMAYFMLDHTRASDKVLEIGCGDCTTREILRTMDRKVHGVDITAQRPDVIECPAWDMPIEDEQFDVTYSTDFLEHIPTEMVDKTISEILRVTKRITIHVIATWPDVRQGEVLHKTVRPIEWWRERFKIMAGGAINVVVIDRDTFLK